MIRICLDAFLKIKARFWSLPICVGVLAVVPLLSSAADQSSKPMSSGKNLISTLEAHLESQTPVQVTVSEIVSLYENGIIRSAQEQQTFKDWKARLTETKRRKLEQVLGDATKKILNKMVGRLKEVPGLKGDLYDSAVYYFSRNSLENYLDGGDRSRLWVHRNPPPDQHQVFILAQGSGRVGDLKPAAALRDVQIWSAQLKGGEKLKLEVGGKTYSMTADSINPMTRKRAEEIVARIKKSQEHIDYEKVCKDGKLKSLFAFGHDQEDTIFQLQYRLRDTKWNSRTREQTNRAKEAFLSESSQSDYIMKQSHAAGNSGIFTMVRSGTVYRYIRVLPKSSGLYQRCPHLKEITEELVLITPPEKGDDLYTIVGHGEFCRAVMNPVNPNGGSATFFDGSCWSEENIQNLYCEMARSLDCDEGGCLNTITSPDMQKGQGFNRNGSIRWKLYAEGFREGRDFDDVKAQGSDEQGSRVIAPGTQEAKSEFEREQESKRYDELLKRLTAGKAGDLGPIVVTPEDEGSGHLIQVF